MLADGSSVWCSQQCANSIIASAIANPPVNVLPAPGSSDFFDSYSKSSACSGCTWIFDGFTNSSLPSLVEAGTDGGKTSHSIVDGVEFCRCCVVTETLNGGLVSSQWHFEIVWRMSIAHRSQLYCIYNRLLWLIDSISNGLASINRQMHYTLPTWVACKSNIKRLVGRA